MSHLSCMASQPFLLPPSCQREREALCNPTCVSLQPCHLHPNMPSLRAGPSSNKHTTHSLQ